MQDWLEANVIKLENFDEESEFYSRSGIVHRLDKDTSGLLVVAKTEDYFDFLQDKFKTREVEKRYIALTLGKINDEIDRIVLSSSMKDKCKINTFVKNELIKLIKRY